MQKLQRARGGAFRRAPLTLTAGVLLIAGLAPAANLPKAPQSLQGARAAGQVVLTWKPGGGPPADRYEVYQRAAGMPDFILAGTVPASETELRLKGLANGLVHEFRVHAVNAEGSSPASKTISVTPIGVPGSPTGVEARVGDVYAVVSTLAGAPMACSFTDSDNGVGSGARFCSPKAGATDQEGNLYVSDNRGGSVRKVTPAGVVTTIAAGVRGPSGITVDKAGNVYVSDTENCIIRRIAPDGKMYLVGGKMGECAEVDGPPAAARFDNPTGLALGPDGTIYTTSYFGCTLRKIATDGTVSTVAGKHHACLDADGGPGEATLGHPAGVALDHAGNLIVVDEDDACTIRKVTPAGVATTLAGSAGQCSAVDGKGPAGRFALPSYIAIDPQDNMYVTDHLAHTLRRVTPDGVVTTVAGRTGTKGEQDGEGPNARLYQPDGVAMDANGVLYIVDRWNCMIRKALMSNRRSVVVSFVAPADNGGAAITGYKVISSPPGGADGDAGSPGLSHTVTGLRSELEYTFTVVAMNAAGEGAASAPSNAVTPGTAGDRR